MKSKKKGNNLGQYVMMFIFVLLGVAFGLFAGRFIAQIEKNMFSNNEGITSSLLSFGILIVITVIAMYVQIIVHEGGHLVFGLFSGYKFSSFRIENFMILKENEKFKIKMIKIAGTGGQCLMTPPQLIDGKIPYVLYGYGGCIANVLVSALLFIVYLLFPNTLLSKFCIISAVLGVFFAIINGIPLKMGLICNDGYNVLAQKKYPRAIRGMWLQLSINERLSSGDRLKDIPEDWLYMPQDDELQNVLTATIGVFYENKLISMQKFDEAITIINRFLNEETAILDLHKNLLICDLIYCKLIKGEEKEEIEKYYNKNIKAFMKQMKKFPSVLRTQYAIDLIHNNNKADADKTFAIFEKVEKNYPYKGDIKDERTLIEMCNKNTKSSEIL